VATMEAVLRDRRCQFCCSLGCVKRHAAASCNLFQAWSLRPRRNPCITVGCAPSVYGTPGH
jgi:hypothetical protein